MTKPNNKSPSRRSKQKKQSINNNGYHRAKHKVKADGCDDGIVPNHHQRSSADKKRNYQHHNHQHRNRRNFPKDNEQGEGNTDKYASGSKQDRAKQSTPHKKRRRRPNETAASYHSHKRVRRASAKNDNNIEEVQAKKDNFPGWKQQQQQCSGAFSSHQNTAKNKHKRRKTDSQTDDTGATTYKNNGSTQHRYQGRQQRQQHANQNKNVQQTIGPSNTSRQTSSTTPTIRCPSPLQTRTTTTTTILLPWPSPNRPISLQNEESLLPLLLLHQHCRHQNIQQQKQQQHRRQHYREYGMMCQQPPSRLPPIIQHCQKHNIELSQALSLRRHHIKALNPLMGMSQLGLGPEHAIRQSAQLFEDCVEQYLKKNEVAYWTEKEQKSRHYALVSRTKERGRGEDRERGRGNGRGGRGARPLLMPPTPDFLLKKPVHLSHQSNTIDSASLQATATPSNKDRHNDDKPINWIEAKMFYGASTIPPYTQNHAVGNILNTATKYTSLYGPGAIVFSYGCGEVLAKRLWDDCGVLVLDAHPLDLSDVERHQRSWCADDSGRILP